MPGSLRVSHVQKGVRWQLWEGAWSSKEGGGSCPTRPAPPTSCRQWDITTPSSHHAHPSSLAGTLSAQASGLALVGGLCLCPACRLRSPIYLVQPPPTFWSGILRFLFLSSGRLPGTAWHALCSPASLCSLLNPQPSLILRANAPTSQPRPLPRACTSPPLHFPVLASCSNSPPAPLPRLGPQRAQQPCQVHTPSGGPRIQVGPQTRALRGLLSRTACKLGSPLGC